jgi:hypothetical protein
LVPKVSSQRAREDRIVEKLGSGALAPASASEAMVLRPPGTTPSAGDRCHGCDESDADALAGDRPWHHLCYLFWQGRSETVRGRLAPSARPDSRVVPERSRWVIVVRADRPVAYATLQRNFQGSAWVDVVVDRRGGTSSGGGRVPGVERRGSQRPRGSPASAPAPAFRRAYGTNDFEVYEATAPLPGRCPQCGLSVTVDLPRFAEPPVRLELTVVHEVIPPATVRHVVEAQSLSATGRVLLATRLLARPGVEAT